MSKQKAMYHLERFLALAMQDNGIPEDKWVQFSIPAKRQKPAVMVIGEISCVPLVNPDGSEAR